MLLDQRPSTRRSLALLVLGTLLLATTSLTANAQDGGPGITKPVVFPAFDPNAAECSAPPGLAKSLAFVQENNRDFLAGVDHGLSLAAKDRGLDYTKALTGDDSANAAKQIQAFLAAKVGGVVATSTDSSAVSRSIQQIIWSGGFAGTIVPPPATLLLNAPQYATGKALTDAAIDYINSKLDGKADVVLLTQDSMQYLAPRFEAMRDGFSKLPGVTIVADIAPNPVNEQSGFDMMNTILLADTNVDVVLGADAVVLGALKALRAAGKARPDQFLGGIDGEPGAVAEIKTINSPYKASISLNSPVFGYAMGNYAADWLDGKSIPQAMDILPIALTRDNIAPYEADLVRPDEVFADPVRRSVYLRMYGNICYDTRDQYVNFPWSSEAK